MIEDKHLRQLGLAAGAFMVWKRKSMTDKQQQRAWLREVMGEARAALADEITHRFTDRKYVSVEDDVIYLQKTGAGWKLAKPSATFYRAIGYDSPPLAAFTPPAGW